MSKIEWTDATWNPVRGCTRVSEGCRNCYAERVAGRFAGPGQPYEGLVTIPAGGTHGQSGRVRTGVRTRWNGQIRLVANKLAEPLRWRKPRMVFVNSMSDLFHEGVPDEYIAAVFGVMAACPQHTFQVLTKRPERALAWFEWMTSPMDIRPSIHRAVEMSGLPANAEQIEANGWPLANVWLGVSVEDQATADERIPLLLQCPAAVRFVSYEPALGPVDFRRYLALRCEGCGEAGANVQFCTAGLGYDDGHVVGPEQPCGPMTRDLDRSRTLGIDWLIIGGESGPGARPCNVEWIRSAVRQCADAGVPCFVKQLGARPYRMSDAHCTGRFEPVSLGLRHRKGGDRAEWPADLRVREWPEVPR